MGSKNNKPVAEIQRWRLEDLVPYERNARTHSPDQVEKIAKSLQEFGWMNPILLDGTEGNIIAGHGRLMAAKLIHDRGTTINNWPDTGTAAVIVHSHLTPQQKRAYVLADNRLALDAGWDNELLAAELEDLKLDDFDISVIGFSEDELAGMFDVEVVPEGKTDEDACGEPPAEPVTRLGDIWIMGKHRLMCGDSTSIDAVDVLLSGSSVDMVYTDPPYGISHSGNGIDGSAQGNKFGGIIGDQDVTVAIDAFRLCTGNWPDARMIFWGANYYPSILLDGHGWLVWDKQREGNTFSGAELAFINGGVRVDVFRHAWHGMIKASEHGQKRVHPTQKPVKLAEWCMDQYGKNCNTVLDLFCGSGSTLIACESAKKIGFMMELSPNYCDVIVKRWQDFTGKQAILESTGQTFAEVTASGEQDGNSQP